MDSRSTKKIIIASVYLFIFAVIAASFYYAFKPEETCTDNKKNQDEEGVDCGGVCKKCEKIEALPLSVRKTGVLESGISGKYDVYAEIENPNNLYGGKNFLYQLKIKNFSGGVLFEKTGAGFILPKETKFILENVIELPEKPAVVEFAIAKTDWVEFNEYYEKPVLKIVNKNYSQVSSGVGYAQASGVVKNDSPFDFEKIKVLVALRDEKGEIVAINSTEMRTVVSNQEREFKIPWPNRFPGDVRDMEAYAEINIFDSEAFIKKYFKSEKFQQTIGQ